MHLSNLMLVLTLLGSYSLAVLHAPPSNVIYLMLVLSLLGSYFLLVCVREREGGLGREEDERERNWA